MAREVKKAPTLGELAEERKKRLSAESAPAESVDQPHSELKLPPDFEIDAMGVWYHPEPKGDKPRQRVPICGPAWVSGLTRENTSTSWGRVVCFKNHDGIVSERAMPMALFHDQGPTVAKELAAEGLFIVPGQERILTKYLGSFDTDVRQTSVDKAGWLDVTDGTLIYVLPKSVIARDKDTVRRVVFQAEKYSPTVSTIRSEGSLEDWQSNVAGPCAGHPYLVFSLCVGLTGPLLKHVRQDGGGFHFYDQTTRGKTTLAQVAASEWGCGADPADAPDLTYIGRWNTTANGLEGRAAAHNDNVQILDELGTCNARDFGKVVYDLSGGQGKSAMDANRNLKKPRSWRIQILSTGEISTQQKIEEENKVARGGQLVRIIDIYTGGNIFQNIEDPAKLADKLKRNSGQFFGTAGPTFVERLIKQSTDAQDLRKTLADLMNVTIGRLKPAATSPEVSRAIKRFALVEMAGILAVRLKVLPFNEKEVTDSINYVLQAWLLNAREIPDIERGISAVRDFILRHREARLKSLPPADPNLTVRELAGYWEKKKRLYLLTDAGFKEACGGHDHRSVASELSKRKLFFKNESNRHMSKHKIPGSKTPLRLYAIREGILDAGYGVPDVPNDSCD